MAKVTPISGHFQHFLAEMNEGFWGDRMGRRSRRGKSFSSGSRSGGETLFPAADGMNGEG